MSLARRLVARVRSRESLPDDHWQQRVSEFRRQNAEQGPRPEGAYVLLGDSLSEEFPAWLLRMVDARFVNRGISSDHLSASDGRSMVDRLAPEVLSFAASRIFVLAGINDLADRPEDSADFLQRYQRLLTALRTRYPAATLVCQTLLPTRGRFSPLNPAVLRANAIIAQLARAQQAELLDLYAVMRDRSGALRRVYSRDGLHLSPLGYLRWSQALWRMLAPSR